MRLLLAGSLRSLESSSTAGTQNLEVQVSLRSNPGLLVSYIEHEDTLVIAEPCVHLSACKVVTLTDKQGTDLSWFCSARQTRAMMSGDPRWSGTSKSSRDKEYVLHIIWKTDSFSYIQLANSYFASAVLRS
jgi:hypothetical protein